MIPSPLQPYHAVHQITELYHSPSKQSRRNSPSLSSLIFVDFPFPMNDDLFLCERLTASPLQQDYAIPQALQPAASCTEDDTDELHSNDTLVHSNKGTLNRNLTLNRNMQRLSHEFAELQKRWNPQQTTPCYAVSDQKEPDTSKLHKHVAFSIDEPSEVGVRESKVRVRPATMNARSVERVMSLYLRGRSIDATRDNAETECDKIHVGDISRSILMIKPVDGTKHAKEKKWPQLKRKVSNKLLFVKSLFRMG